MARLGRVVPPRGPRVVPAPPRTRNAEALGVWTSALAGLSSVPARWLALGGGVTEGQGAGTKGARWLDAALTTLRTSKSVVGGGSGFISAAYGVTGPDSPWAATYVTLSGAATVGTTAGVGGRFVTLKPAGGGPPAPAGTFGTGAFGTAPFGGGVGAGENGELGFSPLGFSPLGGSAPGGAAGTVTFTVTGTSVDVWYIAEPTAGSLSYAVDGGGPTTVSTDGAHALRRIQGIVLGATGSHTVVVTAASGTVYLSGLTVFSGDAGSGIHLYEASRVGATSAAGASSISDLASFASSIAPDLVTIEIPLEDGAAGVSPSATSSNITLITDMLRGLPKVPSIVLVIPFHPAPEGGGSPGPLPRTSWTVSADSEELVGEDGAASNMIDGDTGTIWHTKWSGTPDPLPHTLTIDMHATTTVTALRYLPRPGGGNGTIGQYQVHVSADGVSWGGAVAGGTWADDATEKTASISPATARYVRLTALTEAGNRGPWSSGSEVYLDGGGGVAVAGWPDYVVAGRLMAFADPDLGLVDLSVALPPATAAGGGLYRSGGRYPNDSGHAAIAAAVTSLVDVSVPAPPVAAAPGAFLIFMTAA